MPISISASAMLAYQHFFQYQQSQISRIGISAKMSYRHILMPELCRPGSFGSSARFKKNCVLEVSCILSCQRVGCVDSSMRYFSRHHSSPDKKSNVTLTGREEKTLFS